MSRGAVGSFAARQTTWGRRWPHARPGPLAAAQMGASLPGVPLLPTFVTGYNFAALLGFGVDTSTDPSTWTLTDVSLDVQQSQGISITRGRLDENSTTMPAQCTLTLDNRSGNYSTRRPQSTHYPYVRVGMPLKIVVATAGDTFEQFSGFVDSWEMGWDTSGNYAVVDVTAHGVMQRLGQGSTVLQSALYRALTTTNPVAYWPLEDAAVATYGASAVAGGNQLRITGSPSFSGALIPDATVAFTSGGAPGGSDQLPDFSSGGRMTGVVGSGTSTTSWRVEFSTKMSAIATTDSFYTAMIHIYTTGSIAFHEVLATRLDLGGVYVDYVDTVGGFGPITTSGRAIDDDQWHRITVDGAKSGANIVITVYVDGTLALTTTYLGLTFGRVTNIVVNPMSFYSTRSLESFGHLAVWAPWSSSVNTTYVQSGYTGEEVTARLARLCAEEDVPFVLYGSAGGRTMGPQSLSTLLSLLREVEDVGGGVLEDGVFFGLAYHELESRYNQTAVMTPALNQLEPPLNPVESNQRIRNDVTASSRSSGVSARYTQPAGLPYAPSGGGGIGSYTDSKTFNVDTDGALYSHASWGVFLGTVDADRYTQLAVNFAARTVLIPSWLATVNGSRWTVPTTHATGGLPPDVLIEGWTLDLSTFVFHVQANCSPAISYNLGVTDSSVSGRVGADDTTLAAGIDAAVTSFVVTYTYAWSASAGDYPFGITIGAEDMTLNSVVGTTFNVTRGVGFGGYTSAHNAGDAVTLTRPARAGL